MQAAESEARGQSDSNWGIPRDRTRDTETARDTVTPVVHSCVLWASGFAIEPQRPSVERVGLRPALRACVSICEPIRVRGSPRGRENRS